MMGLNQSAKLLLCFLQEQNKLIEYIYYQIVVPCIMKPLHHVKHQDTQIMIRLKTKFAIFSTYADHFGSFSRGSHKDFSRG